MRDGSGCAGIRNRWFCLARRRRPPRSCRADSRKSSGMIAAEPLLLLRGLRLDLSTAALVGIAANAQRRIGGDHSAEFGCGALAAGRNLRFHSSASPDHLPAVRALGLGGRMARATRRRLRAGPRLRRWWRLQRDPGRGWGHGAVDTWILGPRRESFPPKECRLPFPDTTPCWFCWDACRR